MKKTCRHIWVTTPQQIWILLFPSFMNCKGKLKQKPRKTEFLNGGILWNVLLINDSQHAYLLNKTVKIWPKYCSLQIRLLDACRQDPLVTFNAEEGCFEVKLQEVTPWKKTQLLLCLKYNFQVCTFSPAVEKCANFKFGPQALCRKSLQARSKNYNRYVRCHEHDLLKSKKVSHRISA